MSDEQTNDVIDALGGDAGSLDFDGPDTDEPEGHGFFNEESNSEAVDSEPVETTETTDTVESDDTEPVEVHADTQEHPNINELLEEIRQLRNEVTQQKGQDQEQGQIEEVNFLKDEDSFNDVLSNPQAFNTLLNNVLQASVQVGVQYAQQIATNEAARIVTMKNYSDEFYRLHKDLRGKGPIVQRVAEELVKNNPGMSVEKLFKELPGHVRKVLGSDPKSQSVSGSKPPVTPKARGSRGAATQGKQQATVTDELLDMQGI